MRDSFQVNSKPLPSEKGKTQKSLMTFAANMEKQGPDSGFRTLFCDSVPHLSGVSRAGAIRSRFCLQVTRNRSIFCLQVTRLTAFDCPLSSDLEHNRAVMTGIRSRLSHF